jgi:serine/threonine protein kinase
MDTVDSSGVPQTDECSHFAVGSLVADKYVVEGALGSGGLGAVIVARHRALNHRVAIKYLKSGGKESTIVERFLREARLSAQIQSDHVVKVHDVGELADGSPFMVMEYLEGGDLSDLIQDRGVPIATAVDYVLQACDGLAEAHALGIVHRDIKPENLFLAQRTNHVPVVKIIDFGISKVTSKNRAMNWAHLTSENERFGTPVYMSPEQLRSSTDVDGTTDIWALGVVLFELITGELPFNGGDVPQLCTSILTSPPRRLSALCPAVPQRLEGVILKCLEKDARFRFRNIAEFAQEIARFGPPEAAERVKRIKNRVVMSGISVRPSTPISGSMNAVLLPNHTPLAITLRDRAKTGDGHTLPTPQQRRAPIVIAGAVAVVAMLVLVSIARRPRGDSASGSPQAIAMSRPEAVAIAPLSSAQAPYDDSIEATPTPVASSPVARMPLAPSPAVIATIIPRARRAPVAGITSSASSSSAHAAMPSASMDRRALYGDRN